MTEILITDKVEVAEKGNAHCKKCARIIQNGEPRLKRMHTTRYGYQPTYICYRCAWKTLQEEEQDLRLSLKANKVQFKNLAQIKKKCSKVLIANTLMEDSQNSK